MMLAMKLIDCPSTIEQVNVTGEAQFKMKTSRKAFQILSDLYSDKPLAIVRELGCNASDSHAAAGKKDVPFHIHLPNALEPWITIQDFGTGISAENIYSIYSTYFESTKTQTNDQIGCLGLGSKSPFCYTDNFAITSIYNGEKSIYNAYFNQNNTPAIALMARTQTTEGNGITIQIPVKAIDFGVFKESVKKAFRFFDVKPTISGGEIDWHVGEKLFTTETWDSYTFDIYQCYAVMGGVAYEVSYHHVDQEHYQLIMRGGLVMRFEMGELEFTPSREALSYTPQTRKAINDRMVKIKNEFNEKLQEMIDSNSNILNAILMVNKLAEKFRAMNCMDEFKWRGVDISNPLALIHNISKEDVLTISNKRYGKKGVYKSNRVSLDAKWYVDDVGRGGVLRVVNHLKTLRDSNSDINSICIFPMSAYENLTNNSNSDLNFDPSCFARLSTLSRAPRAASAVKAYTQRKNNLFSVYRMGIMSHTAWVAEEFDASNPPKYYIVKDDQAGCWMPRIRIKGLNQLINTKEDLGLLLRIVGIDKTDVAMVSAKKVNQIEGVATELIGHINTLNPFSVISPDDVATASGASSYELKQMILQPEFNTLDVDHPFRVYVDRCYNSVTLVKQYGKFAKMITDVEVGVAETIKTDCPVLKMLSAKIGHYGWYADDIMLLIKNLKN